LLAQLLHPTSASVERVFSMLEAMIGDDRTGLLADSIEGELIDG